MVKCVWNQNQHLRICEYYNNIPEDNYAKDVSQRTVTLETSSKSLDVRYRELIGLQENHCLYDSFVSDACREVITRWRLSSFDLAIETGRHTRQRIERVDRVCKTCLIMEDEDHVLFACPIYAQIRSNHQQFFAKHNSVKKFLNPTSREVLYETSGILQEIEKTHAEFR